MTRGVRKGREAQEMIVRRNVGYCGESCLIWPSRKKGGYPQVSVCGKFTLVSRFMCILAHGDPPTTQHEAAHSCGNGHLGCFNPIHLRWATRAENAADAIRHGTISRGKKNGMARLTDDGVRAIRADKRSLGAIARDFCVHPTTIGYIKNRKTWKHVA